MTHYLSRCDEMAGCGKTYPADLHKCPNCGADAAFSSPAPLDPRDWGYDIETYPNIFTACFIHAATGMELMYEISDRVNQQQQLIEFMFNLGRSKARGVGFNNLSFDYPTLHFVAHNPGCTLDQIYAKAQSQIKPVGQWAETIWDRDQIFKQIDLYKIWHFDNKSKRTSLKALEVAMRSPNVKDLPFGVGMMLNDEQKDTLIAYNKHDVRETLKFYVRSLTAIHLREQLSETFKKNFVNMNDVKMGETILVTEMQKRGVSCYDESGAKKQTNRNGIKLSEVILPYLRYENPEFARVLEFLKTQTIYETKGEFKGLTLPVVGGLEFAFGKGGMHASLERSIVVTDDEGVIIDADVASFYPNYAVANRIYPAHLGEAYCDAYLSIYETRKTYSKDKPENGAFKLALNGAYGGSNNEHSPFFDSQYTMSTTINGQLLLCMLAEQLVKIPGLLLIQANTDGITFKCPHQHVEHAKSLFRWWEDVTKLELEDVEYAKMCIRDVNSYLAVKKDGKVKRIGAYAYVTSDENPATREVPYHKDPSTLVVPKAAEAALVRGEDIRTFITSHRDKFDFMLRAKVPRAARLVMRWPEWSAEQELQNTTRVFISRNGGSLVKLLPPTGTPGAWKRKNGLKDEAYYAVVREITGQPGDLDSTGIPWDERIHTKSRSKHEVVRESGLCAGWRVTECADANDFDWGSLNYDWYIQEAEKLVLPLLTSTSK